MQPTTLIYSFLVKLFPVSSGLPVLVFFFQIVKIGVACLFLKTVVLQTHLGVILFSSLCRGYIDPLEDLDQNPCVPSKCCFMSLTSHLFLIWTSFLFLPLLKH